MQATRQVSTGLLLAVAVAFGLSAAACRRTPEARLARFMASGQRHFEQKDFARAILDYQNAVRLAPSDPEPYYRLALAHLETGNFRTGVALLRKVTELNPKHVGAQVKLAELMATSRRQDILEEAAERARTAAALAPGDPAALNALAVTELRLNRPEQARAHLEQVLEKAPANLQALITLAKMKLAEKDLAGAEAVLRQAAGKVPNSPDVAVALADFYLLAGKLPQAEAELNRALQLDGNNGPAILRLAQLRLQAGQIEEADRLYQRLSALPEKSYRAAHALFLLSRQRTAEAIAELEKLQRADPSDRDLRSRLLTAYLINHRAPEAENLLNSALKRNPNDIQALLERAAIHVRAGRAAEAETDLLKVLRLAPDSAEARFHMATVHRLRGQSEAAKQELGEALRLKPVLLEARLELAGAWLEENSPKAALDLIEAAPEPQKSDLRLMALRNRALLALPDWPGARKAVEESLRVARTAEFLTQEARLRLHAKDVAGARKSLEEALQRDPQHLPALTLLAKSYAEQKQIEAGLARVREHVSRQPSSAALQMFLGNWLFTLGRHQEARTAFQAARQADPKMAAPALRLAQLDVMEGNPDSGRRILQGLLASGSEPLAARLLLGSLETRAGNYQAAIGHYRKALEINPRSVMALNDLAYLLVEHDNQVDEGLRLAQRAKELAPDNAAVDDTIGWAFYRKGLYGSALPHLERAAAGANASALHHYHLAMTHLKSGELAKARTALERARRLDPRLTELKEADRLLAEARASLR